MAWEMPGNIQNWISGGFNTQVLGFTFLTKNMTTSAAIRRTEIVRILKCEHYLRVAELSQRFGVSQTSIHRDLRQLEKQNLLNRTHGSLVATPLLRLGLEVSPNVAHQILDVSVENKEIARVAAALVQPGDRLIFDSGILSYLTACSLPGVLLTQGELTIITNSLLVALELAPWQGVETIMLGGEYQANRMMNVTGPRALRSLEGLHADKMFLSVDAIDIRHGVTIAVEEDELALKMIEACANVILLVEKSKMGEGPQAHRTIILPISAVQTLVTNQEAPLEFVAYLRSQGAEVILA